MAEGFTMKQTAANRTSDIMHRLDAANPDNSHTPAIDAAIPLGSIELPGEMTIDPIDRMYAEAFEGETENERAKRLAPEPTRFAPSTAPQSSRVVSVEFLAEVARGTYSDATIALHVREVGKHWTPEAIAERRRQNDAAHDRREG